MKWFQATYMSNRVFYALAADVLIFALGFAFPWLVYAGVAWLGLTFLAIGYDAFQLFRSKQPVQVTRSVPKLLSLFDVNQVTITLNNESLQTFSMRVIDELPFQFQKRDFEYRIDLAGLEQKTIVYELTPTKRGEYHFGRINVFLTTELGLVQRRTVLGEEQMVKVYPSIIQMHAYELMVFSADRMQEGIKKIRRLGHGYEFSDIRSYVIGDDPRTINWKASSRSTELMVNNYRDERSQQIYAVINTSRVMRMPFGGLSLMDYAINATLSMQNIVLQSHDHAGLITFSDTVNHFLRAERKFNQRQLLLESLYNVHEDQGEPNYQALYEQVQKRVRGRSMLLLFTNFMSYNSLMRVLPDLKRLNRSHLLVVVFFKNTELDAFEQKEVNSLLDISSNILAAKLLNELTQVVYELRNAGIQAIHTEPENLTSNAINKYLEMKSRGFI